MQKKNGNLASGAYAYEREKLAKVTTAPSGVHAVFAIDPGGTTGVAAGQFDLDAGSLKDVLRSRKRAKAAEVTGTWREQASKMATIVISWTMDCERFGIPKDRRHVVAEDFVLRLPAKATTLTSIWVIACLQGLIDSMYEIEFRQASQAKGFATDDRLKLWEMWEVGSAHKRDAWRHVALKIGNMVP